MKPFIGLAPSKLIFPLMVYQYNAGPERVRDSPLFNSITFVLPLFTDQMSVMVFQPMVLL